jgi:prevent-host-death family protein
MSQNTKRSTNQENIIGLKELRENMGKIIERVQDGEEFTVLKRSKPAFRVSPLSEGEGDSDDWETVADFTEIDKNGVSGREILQKIQKIDG